MKKSTSCLLISFIFLLLGYIVLSLIGRSIGIMVIILINQLWLIAALFFHFFEERVEETKRDERWMRTDTK